MTARMIGLGTAVPPYSISQEQSATVARRFVHNEGSSAKLLPMLYRMTTVQTRGSVLLEAPSQQGIAQSFYPQSEGFDDAGPTTAERMQRYVDEAGPLATSAAAEALAQAGLAGDQVTHLVTATCTGFHAPGVDIDLIENLELPLTTQRVQVGFMGCHGGINALRAARGLVAADPGATVLVVAVELCSLHYQYGWDTDRVVANALFADGAAAVVIRGEGAAPSNGHSARANGASTNGAPANGAATHGAPANGTSVQGVPTIADTGSMLVPGTRDAMSWLVGDNGFEMTLSAEVPNIVERDLRGFLQPWLQERGVALEEIQGWAVHPGGPRILSAVETALGLDAEALATSRRVLAEHGNMSSATMLFIMDQFARQERPRPWVGLGFGPGLEIEVVLVR